MIKTIAAVVGAITAFLALGILFGGFVAMLWNHFPFLDSLHHMSWWDGILLHLLGGFLFKSTSFKTGD